MNIENINPYLRFAEMQTSILQGNDFRLAYDYRIFYVISGKGTVVLEDKNVQLSPNSIVMIPPAIKYHFKGALQVIVLNFDLYQLNFEKSKPLPPDSIVDFKPELVFEDVRVDELNAPIILHNCNNLRSILNEIVAEYNFKNSYYNVMISSLLKNIICQIVRNDKNIFIDENDLISKVLIYIKTNYHTVVKNSDISKALGYNELYLNRIFKKHVGTTIHQYLLNERIGMAKKLLKETNISVESVARNCGFDNMSTFYVVFKKMTGFSPKQYRYN